MNEATDILWINNMWMAPEILKCFDQDPVYAMA